MSETAETTDQTITDTAAEKSTDVDAATTDHPDDATQEKLTKLRSEAHNLRTRTKAAEARADELARALFTARVAATGKVANPDEIAYDADILDDMDAINAAIDAAITERPYIRAHKVSGDVGQGPRGESTGPKDFSALFR